jgi:hypothetical protein
MAAPPSSTNPSPPSVDPLLDPKTAVMPEGFIRLLEASKTTDYSIVHVDCPMYLAGLLPHLFDLHFFSIQNKTSRKGLFGKKRCNSHARVRRQAHQ